MDERVPELPEALDDAERVRREWLLFRAIAENCRAVIGAKDLAGRYLYVNSEYTRLFGLPAAHFLGHDDFAVFPPEIATAFRANDALALASAEPIAVEEQALVDGELRDFLSIKFCIRDGGGQPLATGLIATDISERKQMERALHRAAETDALTGCWNRRKLYDEGAAELARAQRYRRPLALAMLDLDHFKSINDQYGHACGDAVLSDFVEICRKQLRESDRLARVGGEEFVALLPETGIDEATRLAERLRKAVAAAVLNSPDGQPLSINVSIGVAALGPGIDSLDRLIDSADHAMYAAKTAGRNRVETA